MYDPNTNTYYQLPGVIAGNLFSRYLLSLRIAFVLHLKISLSMNLLGLCLVSLINVLYECFVGGAGGLASVGGSPYSGVTMLGGAGQQVQMQRPISADMIQGLTAAGSVGMCLFGST